MTLPPNAVKPFGRRTAASPGPFTCSSTHPAAVPSVDQALMFPAASTALNTTRAPVVADAYCG